MQALSGAVMLVASGLFAIASVVAVSLPPIYRSEAKILVESQQIPTDLVRSTVTGLAASHFQLRWAMLGVTVVGYLSVASS